MKLHTLLNALPLVKPTSENPEITCIVNDHRKVEQGALFICIKGHTADGHQFAKEAAEQGASAILSEKHMDLPVPVVVVRDTKYAMAVLADTFYQHPTSQLHLVGITGTNGKTTTTFILDEIFKEAGQKTGLIGTISMKIGDRVIETKNTTPDTIVLQETFADMVSHGVNAAVMEVSSHALVQGRVNGCDFDVAVFTNLSQDHLDYHETMEEYQRAKGLLFTKLGNTYATPKFAVINADDPAGGQFIADTSAHVVTYGIDHPADFSAEHLKIGRTGTTFTLSSPEGKTEIALKLMGKFSVYNTLAAIAAGYVSGVPLETIIRTVEKVHGVPGRFESVDEGQDFSVIVDYAHTPDSLENVLKTIGEFAGKRVFAIVGCGGDRDRTKRPLMAKVACDYATDPIFTSDNPRTEDPLAILNDMEQGVKGRTYQVIPDRKKAIVAAIQAAHAGDIVLIAGKGHETYQIIGNQVLDFDDRQIARNAIKEYKKC
ncbi:UDP-N-acetylmuramoyl-L-alanyl-D-glutamate--2,6-diaminopimelate ligase [Siminovitchia sediminis]|uniref:UDP-N-acetylmuramoyl-L-alanyl-D-glutamate--2,6-diaminopimelate ligase n=1 Tax=Siminovitchia sediminis TaxID=1274353 RepID=A0ABW4KDD0_9BACI